MGITGIFLCTAPMRASEPSYQKEQKEEKHRHVICKVRLGALRKCLRDIKQCLPAAEERDRGLLLSADQQCREALAIARTRYTDDYIKALGIHDDTGTQADKAEYLRDQIVALRREILRKYRLLANHPHYQQTSLTQLVMGDLNSLREYRQKKICYPGGYHDISRYIADFVVGGGNSGCVKRYGPLAAALCSKLILAARGSDVFITSLAIHPGGQKVALGWSDGLIRILNLKDGRFREYAGLQDGDISDIEVIALSWDSHGRLAGAINDSTGVTFSINDEVLTINPSIAERRQNQDLILDDNDDNAPKAYIRTRTHTFWVYENSNLAILDRTTNSRTIIGHPTEYRGIQSLAANEGGTSYVLADGEGRKGYFGKILTSGRWEETMANLYQNSSIAPVEVSVNEQGAYGAIASHGLVVVWDYDHKKVLCRINPPQEKRFHSVQMIGNKVATVTHDGTIYFYDPIRRRSLCQIEPQPMQRYVVDDNFQGKYVSEVHDGLQVSSNGDALVTYSLDGAGQCICWYKDLNLLRTLNRLAPIVLNTCSGLLSAAQMVQAARTVNSTRCAVACRMSDPERLRHWEAFKKNSASAVMAKNLQSHLSRELILKFKSSGRDPLRKQSKKRKEISSSSSSLPFSFSAQATR